jgi:ABC-type transporter Mla subunit MlaD
MRHGDLLRRDNYQARVVKCGVAIPDVESIVSGSVRWGGAMVREISQAPSTIRTTREGAEEITRLIRELNNALERVNKTAKLLDAAVTPVGHAVKGIDARVRELDTAVDKLGGIVGALTGVVGTLQQTVTGLIGVIPGANRALRRGRPEPE